MTSDAELISRSLSGDREIFVEIVSRHETALGAYLVRRVGRDAAEDLLSEVWTAAFRSRETYDIVYPDARPWLFGIAHNMVSRHWRSRPAEDLQESLELVTLCSDPWRGVDERLNGGSVLRLALARLTDREREVLTLVVWEELSLADAARVLGIPAGTARYLLHQARLTLRNDPTIVELMNEFNSIKETQ